MRLVIDIPDEEYERIQAMDWKNGDRWYPYETIAIHNGTLLPKGHGRIIDESKITTVSYSAEKHWIDEKTGYHYFSPSIIRGTDAPTIIDKEGRQR